MPTNSQQGTNWSIGGPCGLNTKTVTGVTAWIHGIVAVIEIAHAAGTIFIKVRGCEIEHGGTAEWGSGTKVRT